ncbi:MAG: HlyD family efflux transporter periplasmic adaptor subunit [Clostridia bacterium]|nr:HlyD family efflux transporter periplasmic adaptor subunit [Clostridia bacterium]
MFCLLLEILNCLKNIGVFDLEKLKFKKPAKRTAIISAFVILIFFLLIAYTNSFQYKGEVEALILPSIAEVPGKISASDIDLGQLVKKGDILVQIDSSDLQYTLAQLEFNLQKRKLALGEATIGEGGQASNTYTAAQANYNSATVAAQKALNDYKNAEKLYEEGGISDRELQQANVSYTSAQSLQAAAFAQLNNALNQAGQSNAQIDIAILENQISQAKETLAKYTLTAPCDGVILSKNYGEGSIVAPGYNICDIASFEEIYVVFYVSESTVADIQYDAEIKVKAGGESVLCIVKYIDIRSEYTPRELQTSANNGKTNFKVKLLVPPDSSLKPGMEVTVLL